MFNKTWRPLGVSPRARHSTSANRRLLPEPVGPTIQTISPALITSASASDRPSLPKSAGDRQRVDRPPQQCRSGRRGLCQQLQMRGKLLLVQTHVMQRGFRQTRDPGVDRAAGRQIGKPETGQKCGDPRGLTGYPRNSFCARCRAGRFRRWRFLRHGRCRPRMALKSAGGDSPVY